MELTQEQKDVLDAIKEKIDSQIEQKASKEQIEAVQKNFEEKMAAFKSEYNESKFQEQLDKLFERTDKINFARNPQSVEKEQVVLTNKWVRAMIHRNVKGMSEAEKELKTYDGYFEPSLHVGLSGTGTATATQGEYTIPDLMLSEINRFVEEFGVARRDMRYLPFSGPGNSRKLLVGATAVVVGWVDEAGTKPKSKPTITKVTQELNKLAVIVPMTEEIVEDSAINLVSYVSTLIAEAVTEEEDRVFLTGDIGAGDPFDGVINATGVTAATLAVGTTAANVSPDDLNALIYEVDTPARRGAKFYMHPSIFSALQTYRADSVAAGDGSGGYLVQQPVNGGPASLWGYPIVLTDSLPAAGDVGWEEPFMFFANLQKTSVYGDKQGLRVKMLDQASLTDDNGQVINLAENDMVAIRAYKRVGYVNVLPAGIGVLSTNTAT